jgi:hypothetical protein
MIKEMRIFDLKDKNGKPTELFKIEDFTTTEDAIKVLNKHFGLSGEDDDTIYTDETGTDYNYVYVANDGSARFVKSLDEFSDGYQTEEEWRVVSSEEIKSNLNEEMNENNENINFTLLQKVSDELKSHDLRRNDQKDVNKIADLIKNNKLSEAARLIQDLDTGIKELVMEDIQETYEDLLDIMFDFPDGYFATAQVKSNLNENETAKTLYQMFKDEDLLDDRREYDVEDLMSTYPDLSQEEAEKLEKMLQDPSNLNEEMNENKNIASILRSWDAAKGDRLDYQTVANMIEIGRYEAAAKFISDELDTSVKEMIMDIIEENDPKLYKKMFNSTADSSKFKRSNTLTPIAAAFRISKGEDYKTLAQQYPNLNDPEVKAQIMDLIDGKD